MANIVQHYRHRLLYRLQNPQLLPDGKLAHRQALDQFVGLACKNRLVRIRQLLHPCIDRIDIQFAWNRHFLPSACGRRHQRQGPSIRRTVTPLSTRNTELCQRTHPVTKLHRHSCTLCRYRLHQIQTDKCNFLLRYAFDDNTITRIPTGVTMAGHQAAQTSPAGCAAGPCGCCR